MNEETKLDEFVASEASEEDGNFKQTVAGKIPVDWSTSNVEQVCELRNGEATKYSDIGAETYPVYGSNGPIGSYPEPNFDGGLIFGRVGAVGEVERVTEPVWVSDNAIQARVAGEINTEFLYYSLKNRELSALATKTAQPLLNQSTIGNVTVPTPPLEEQRKIATVLYNIDQAIKKTTELIETRKTLKQGLMQDIFRYGINSKGKLRWESDDSYKETKYGLAPNEWDIIPLEKIVSEDAPITYGIVKPGDHHPNGVPVVKVENIKDGHIDTRDLLHTDPELHQKYKRAELQEGDLLFTIRGTVGRMAFVPGDLEGGNLTQDTARIRVEDANPRYVRYYLETAAPSNYFERHTKGQAVQGINLEDLQEVPVHLPSREEQDRIVEILDIHNEQLDTERQYRRILQRLKQGLMQDLLSGKVRTTDTNIEVLPEVAAHG